jgi:hypothetical protein
MIARAAASIEHSGTRAKGACAMSEKDREHAQPGPGTSNDRSDKESGRPVQLDHERPEKEPGRRPGADQPPGPPDRPQHGGQPGGTRPGPGQQIPEPSR